MSSEHNEKQRLWVVTARCDPEALSAAGWFNETEGSLTDEFEVKAIGGWPSSSSEFSSTLTFRAGNDVEVIPVRSTSFSTVGILSRAVNAFTLGVSMLWGTLRNFRKGDRILVSTAPLCLPFIAAFASLIKGGSYNLLINAVYPDRLIALGKLEPDSVAVKVIHFANAWLFKHAAQIIVVGPNLAELVSARTHGLNIPIKTIPSLTDTDDPREIELGIRNRAETENTLDAALDKYRAAYR